jgi:hypothetical protein
MPAEIDGEIVLRAIVAQHGLFLERARDIYSFAHLTFQEYFTARYVVENEARGTLPRLIEHYDDFRYREVFLLTAAQLPDASEFLALFVKRLVAHAKSRPAVGALLRQVAHKAFTVTEATRSSAAKSRAYLSLALALYFRPERDLDLDPDDVTELEFAYDKARDFVLDFASDHDPDVAPDLNLAVALTRFHGFASILKYELDLDRYLTLSPDFDLTGVLTRGSEIALARAGVLSRTHHRTLARDTALVNTRLILELIAELPDKEASFWSPVAGEFISAAVHQSAVLGDVETEACLAALEKLVISASLESDRGQLGIVTEELQSILETLDLIFPKLDKEDWYWLSRYIDGNRLLLACLEQAVVADREAIKDRLLLLPPE